MADAAASRSSFPGRAGGRAPCRRRASTSGPEHPAEAVDRLAVGLAPGRRIVFPPPADYAAAAAARGSPPHSAGRACAALPDRRSDRRCRPKKARFRPTFLRRPSRSGRSRSTRAAPVEPEPLALELSPVWSSPTRDRSSPPGSSSLSRHRSNPSRSLQRTPQPLEPEPQPSNLSPRPSEAPARSNRSRPLVPEPPDSSRNRLRDSGPIPDGQARSPSTRGDAGRGTCHRSRPEPQPIAQTRRPRACHAAAPRAGSAARPAKTPRTLTAQSAAPDDPGKPPRRATGDQSPGAGSARGCREVDAPSSERSGERPGRDRCEAHTGFATRGAMLRPVSGEALR